MFLQCWTSTELADALLISKMTATSLWTFRISMIKNMLFSVCLAWMYAICYAWGSLKYSSVMCNFMFFFWIGESELVNDLCALLSAAWSFWTAFFCNRTLPMVATAL
jgi:hypothetical protein